MKNRLIVPLFCILLTACFAYGAPVDQTEELSDSLLIWHNWPDPESQLLTDIIERFEETHPRVRITTEYVPPQKFNDQYIDRASSGLEPDLIIGLEPYLLYELTERGLLLDLSDEPLKMDELLPGSVESLQRSGAQMAVPFAAYTNVLFFNRAHVFQPIETLDEMISAASEGVRFAVPTDFYHAYWGIHAFGGEIISEDGTLVEDLAFGTWLYWLQEAQREPTILLNHVYEDLYQSFASGQASYLIGNSFDLPYLEAELGVGNVGVAPLPGLHPGDGPGSFLELQTMAVTTNASPAQVDLAVELMNFFINPSQQRRIALSNFGQIPLHERITFDDRLVPITAVLIEQASRSNLFSIEFTPKTDMLRIFGTETYIQVLEGVVTPREGIDQLIERVEEVGELEEVDILQVAQFHTLERTLGSDQIVDASIFIDVTQKASIYLNRPIVQAQLLAIVVVLFVAWMISDLFWLVVRRAVRWLRWPVDGNSARYMVVTTLGNLAPSPQNRIFAQIILGIETMGRLIYGLIEASTFPILAFFMLMWVRAWSLDQGLLGGLLLKMEWVIGAVLVYSFASVILLEIFDETTARSANNRYLRPAFFTCLGLAILHNLADIFMVADIILTTVFNSPVTVRALFLSTIGLYLWIGLIRIVQDVLYHFILSITSQDAGEVKATLTLGRYILIIAAIGYLFTLFQFDTTTMAAITGGLSIGVGFALREILGNFISGFILLFERSLHPGDVIEVDDELSVVEEFSIRATTVRTRNNEEVVIPNQTFFTSSFKTYTGTDNKVRVSLKIQTDCVINPRKVIGLLKTAGLKNANVLNDPAPSAELLDYGNNVATFKLHIWIIDPMRSSLIMSEVKLAIWDALKEHDVALPFPEIELHFPKEKIELRADGLPVI